MFPFDDVIMSSPLTQKTPVADGTTVAAGYIVRAQSWPSDHEMNRRCYECFRVHNDQKSFFYYKVYIMGKFDTKW